MIFSSSSKYMRPCYVVVLLLLLAYLPADGQTNHYAQFEPSAIIFSVLAH